MVSECRAYTYILRCRDGTLYTGWTNDIEKRLRDHNSGCGAKYTRSRRPAELAYLERFETRHAAMHRECEIKRMTRGEKLLLVAEWEKEMRNEAIGK